MHLSEKRTKMPHTEEQAMVIALQALAFFAADETRLDGLMSVTGLTPQDLRSAAADPAFLGGIVDYLLTSEPLLLEFASQENLPPEVVMQARLNLPGGFDAA
jgi:hypothetical protein